MKKSDMMIGMYILAAIVFMLIPIPTGLLDVLMALNIAVSMIILFNALFSQEVLNMSTFPSILLFTTVFRIS
ncbi:MAG: FHIPEP family type III secretion protein, partial [Oscillospiraceae bacterium]|nr:FHIPEP family type III secretion protein [Oscillospiraceae bacterium]